VSRCYFSMSPPPLPVSGGMHSFEVARWLQALISIISTVSLCVFVWEDIDHVSLSLSLSPSVLFDLSSRLSSWQAAVYPTPGLKPPRQTANPNFINYKPICCWRLLWRGLYPALASVPSEHSEGWREEKTRTSLTPAMGEAWCCAGGTDGWMSGAVGGVAKVGVGWRGIAPTATLEKIRNIFDP